MKYLSYILIIIAFLFNSLAYPQLIHDFKVNDDTAGNVFRHHASISTNKNGLSVIVWEENNLQNIFAQIYEDNFIKINNNFKINTGIDSSHSPNVIVTDKEKIGIVWSKTGRFYGQLFFRLFNKYGIPLTSVIQLNDSLNGYYVLPNIGCDSSGRYIVTWSYGYSNIFYQILDSSGNKIGNNVKVNEGNNGWGQQDITVRKDGSFIIVWKDSRYPGDNIYMQMFNKNGLPIGINQKVNDSISALYYSFGTPKIAQDSLGNFTIAFKVYIYNDNSNYIKYQRYDKNGVKFDQNKDLPSVPGEMIMTSFDCDKEGNLIFQMNLNNAATYYIYNIRIDKNDNPIGIYFPVSNEYINSGKGGEDIKLYNKRIINIWRDIRSGQQPQIYANVRSFINPDSTVYINKISNTIPDKYFLYQNYPNPFNSISKIKYQISKAENRIPMNRDAENSNWKTENGFVSIKIFDVLGREVTTLINEKQEPGVYEVNIEGNNFSTGIYFYSLYINNKLLETKKMLLLK